MSELSGLNRCSVIADLLNSRRLSSVETLSRTRKESFPFTGSTKNFHLLVTEQRLNASSYSAVNDPELCSSVTTDTPDHEAGETFKTRASF